MPAKSVKPPSAAKAAAPVKKAAAPPATPVKKAAAPKKVLAGKAKLVGTPKKSTTAAKRGSAKKVGARHARRVSISADFCVRKKALTGLTPAAKAKTAATRKAPAKKAAAGSKPKATKTVSWPFMLFDELGGD